MIVRRVYPRMDDSAQKIQPGSVCRVPYSAAGFGDALTSDWAHDAPGATAFFPHRNWRDTAAEISSKTYPRAEVARVLEASAKELGAPKAALKNTRLLADEKTYVVATGQQAGFLGGPLYALHKALTAIAVAHQYERDAEAARGFVPVFWVAGDDHDLAEIDHAHFLDSQGKRRSYRRAH